MKGYLNYERNIEKSQIMNLIKLPSKIPRVCTRSQNINRAEQKRKQEKKTLMRSRENLFHIT